MVEILEQRLVGVDENADKQVRTALSIPHINPRERWQNMPYLKYNLTDRIVDAILPEIKIGGIVLLKKRARNFSQNLYSVVNKDPLKRVYYGVLSTGEMPKKFLEALTDWEKVYFFAGRWTIRDSDLSEPLDVLTVRHLKAGLENLYEGHYVRKAKRQYTRQLQLPEGKEVREAYRRIISAYEKQGEPQTEEPRKPKIIMPGQGRLF